MLYREIIAVCSEIHIKHINKLCGQNVVSSKIKPRGTYSNHWGLSFKNRKQNECTGVWGAENNNFWI